MNLIFCWRMTRSQAKKLLTAYLKHVGAYKGVTQAMAPSLVHWAARHFGETVALKGKGSARREMVRLAGLVPADFDGFPAPRLVAANGVRVPPPKRDRYRSRAKADEFYSSWEWLKLRRVVLERDGFRCIDCGADPKLHRYVRLVVDHVQPLRANWSLRLDPANLRTRCDECNRGKSNLTLEQLAFEARWLKQAPR